MRAILAKATRKSLGNYASRIFSTTNRSLSNANDFPNLTERLFALQSLNNATRQKETPIPRATANNDLENMEYDLLENANETVYEQISTGEREVVIERKLEATTCTDSSSTLLKGNATINGTFKPKAITSSFEMCCTEKDSHSALQHFRYTNSKPRKDMVRNLSEENYRWFLQQLYDTHGTTAATTLVTSLIHKSKRLWYTSRIIHNSIYVLLQNKQMDAAFELSNYLVKFNIRAKPFVYRLAIKQFIHIGETDKALKLYNAAKEANSPLNDSTAMIMLKAMLRDRKYTGLEDVADDLWNFSQEPIESTVLELLLNAYSKAGNIPHMQDMCMRLLDQERQLRAPIIAIMISAYAKCNMGDEALDMVDVLLQTHNKLDHKVQYILITTIVSVSGPEEAEQVLDMLETHNFLTSARCHSILAKEYASHGQHSKVLSLFDRAEELGLSMVAPFYTIAVNSALKYNNLPKARAILSRMKPLVDSGETKQDTFHSLQLHLYSREGRHDKVKEIWDSRLKNSQSKNSGLSLYLDSAGHNCDTKTVLDIWHTLQSDGFDLNDENLLNSYLEALLRRRQHDLALRTFEKEFQERPIAPTAKTLITVLQPLAEREDIAAIKKFKSIVWHRYPALIPYWQKVQDMLEQQIMTNNKHKRKTVCRSSRNAKN